MEDTDDSSNHNRLPPLDDEELIGENTCPTCGNNIHPEISARSAFLAWEKLRVVYNLILAIEVLLLSGTQGFSALQDRQFWMLLGQGVFAANFYFCVGPWVEGWLGIAGADRNVVRWLLFVPGMLIACLLSAAVVLLWHFPWFD